MAFPPFICCFVLFAFDFADYFANLVQQKGLPCDNTGDPLNAVVVVVVVGQRQQQNHRWLGAVKVNHVALRAWVSAWFSVGVVVKAVGSSKGDQDVVQLCQRG